MTNWGEIMRNWRRQGQIRRDKHELGEIKINSWGKDKLVEIKINWESEG
jgi:hypothetical protein